MSIQHAFPDGEVGDWDYEGWEEDAAGDLLGPEVTVPCRAALAALSLQERTQVIARYIRYELARVLHVPPHAIETSDRTMNSLGVGSVAGLQLQSRLETALQIEVNLQMLVLANSADQLIECLAKHLGPDHLPSAQRSRHTP